MINTFPNNKIPEDILALHSISTIRIEFRFDHCYVWKYKQDYDSLRSSLPQIFFFQGNDNFCMWEVVDDSFHASVYNYEYVFRSRRKLKRRAIVSYCVTTEILENPKMRNLIWTEVGERNFENAFGYVTKKNAVYIVLFEIHGLYKQRALRKAAKKAMKSQRL